MVEEQKIQWPKEKVQYIISIIGVGNVLGLMLPFWAKGNGDGINTGNILNIETHIMVICEKMLCKKSLKTWKR